MKVRGERQHSREGNVTSMELSRNLKWLMNVRFVLPLATYNWWKQDFSKYFHQIRRI